MKKYLSKINFIFFLILPFVDILTSLSTRFIDFPISLGILIKSLYILFLTIYIFFKSKSAHRKKYIIYFIMVAIYSCLYFLTKLDLLNSLYLFNEVSQLFKVVYGSLLFFAAIVIYDDLKYREDNLFKLMFYSLITYSLLLIIPTITHTNFNSYTSKNNEGSIGWYYAANDISAILLMLYPFIYLFFNKKVDNNKKSYLWYLLLIPIIYSIFIIGTKTSWLGLILITLILLIIYILKKEKKKNIIVLTLVLISTCLLTFISPTTTNMNKEVDRLDNKTKEVVNTNNSSNKKTVKEKAKENVCSSKKITAIIKNKDVYKILHLIFSGRENKAYTLSLIYKDSNFSDKLFGIGFSNTKRINNCFVEKYIEIDIIDIFIHYGIFGFILVLIPYAYVIKRIIKGKYKLELKNIIYVFIPIIMIGISLVAGHIIGYPTSNIYLSIYLLLIIINIEKGVS